MALLQIVNAKQFLLKAIPSVPPHAEKNTQLKL
jgi:hypothetical protein